MPGEGIVFSDQNVGMAIAIEVDELEVGPRESRFRRGKDGKSASSGLSCRTGRDGAFHYAASGSRRQKIHEFRAGSARVT
jgi:hypothetical protein